MICLSLINNVFFVFVFSRDRSDTSVVGSSRPVCKTNPNQHTLLLTSLSPTLFGFIHPSQEHSVNKDPIVSFVYCAFLFVFLHLCWYLNLCVTWCSFWEEFSTFTRFTSEKSLLWHQKTKTIVADGEKVWQNVIF